MTFFYFLFSTQLDALMILTPPTATLPDAAFGLYLTGTIMQSHKNWEKVAIEFKGHSIYNYDNGRELVNKAMYIPTCCIIYLAIILLCIAIN